MLPGAIKLQDSSLRLMNLLGAGLMIGTALAVIIPEGAEAYYSTKEPPHGVFGLALVGGFLLMLFLDSINFTGGSGVAPAHDFDAPPPLLAQTPRPLHQLPGFTTLVGILFHSGADGIALGSAAFAESAHVGTLISLAIVLHKAPTAFGLSTYLLKCGWNWSEVRQGIFLFAIAAPLVAIAGYGLLGSMPAFTAPESVAFCLLLSGGTFLYAACIHILPEALKGAQEKAGGHHHQIAMHQVVAVASAALVPLVFSLFHSHGHDHGGDIHDGHDHGHAHGQDHVHSE